MGGPTWEELPPQLKLLIDRSVRLQERVVRLDGAMTRLPVDGPAENAVQRAQSRIAGAFQRSAS